MTIQTLMTQRLERGFGLIHALNINIQEDWQQKEYGKLLINSLNRKSFHDKRAENIIQRLDEVIYCSDNRTNDL